jgi:putative ABC transport system permease protein
MSAFRLIIAAFFHHWRMNLAVAAGAAVGTAVLAGALLVGDSMRGSLQYLALDRLGKIDEALIADRFFRVQLADELEKIGTGSKQHPTHTSNQASSEAPVRIFSVPAIILSASLENSAPSQPLRANRVQLIGCDQPFWQLGPSLKPAPALKSREIVLNVPLAEKLAVKPGDEVIVRLPRLGAIAADSALGQKRDTVQNFRLTVSSVIPADGLGRFGLRPTQHVPLNAFIAIDWLQERLEQPGRANAIFVQLQSSEQKLSSTTGSKVQNRLRPKLTDLGLGIEKTRLGYINISSNRMILEPGAEKEIFEVLSITNNALTPGPSPKGREEDLVVQPAFTYLANTIADGPKSIPYSTITAIDFAEHEPLGPFLSIDGKPLQPLQDDEIALNSWAADELKAKPGDRISVAYFEPESAQGQIRETTKSFRLAAVVQLVGAAADRALTPTVKGMTDEATMADWDPPFPFDAKRVRSQDEKYWDQHGATPKAFVSLATGRRLWGSRFGHTTSLRLQMPAGMSSEDLEKRLSALDPAAFGLVFQPVKQQALAAAAGTTPFNVLFLAFSFFIIAAAVMLVLLLFRLGVEQRAREIGILLALGLTRKQVRRILLGEGFIIATVGGFFGLMLGIGYAALMLLGLRTWWLAAIVTPFLQLYITPSSLVIGFIGGILIAMCAIAFSVSGITRVEPRRLLAGQISAEFVGMKGKSVRARTAHVGATVVLSRLISWPELVLILLVVGTILVLLLGVLKEDYQAAAFFGAGAVVLLSLLGLAWLRLRSRRTGPAVTAGRGNLLRMALRNAARNPGRSTLTISLVAAASFLIVAVSAFRLDLSRQIPALDSGNGGFSLAAETDQPIYQNLDTPQGRAELGFSAEDEKQFAGVKVYGLRVKSGDDASCLNLYRPRQPRLLGLPQQFIDHGGFAWADRGLSQFLRSKNGTVPLSNALSNGENPWTLLHQDLGQDADGVPRVPVILEKNTANYSLNLWGGPGETFEILDEQGKKIRLQVVALLGNSIFQGDLLLDEAALLKYFPQVAGYRFFLLETPPDKTKTVQTILERTLGDYGFTVETSADRLAGFLAVQNTYLSTFQSLGGLGLLLGTLGLAAVQLRNVVERRGELALLRAAGFRRRTLAGLVLLENLALLLAGLACGIFSALVAILPHLITHDASIPWLSLAVTLILVLAVGVFAGLIASARVLRAPLLSALREER